MRLVTLFAAAVLLTACAEPPAKRPVDPPPPAGVLVQTPTEGLLTPEMRAVLPSEEALNLAHQCSRVSPGPVHSQWTPTDADLAALEPYLASLIADRLTQAGNEASPAEYFRQYAGFVIGGRRVIYINGFHRSLYRSAELLMAYTTPDGRTVYPPRNDGTWRTRAELICDGGPITFGVEYNPATRRFSNFAFNGSI